MLFKYQGKLSRKDAKSRPLNFPFGREGANPLLHVAGPVGDLVADPASVDVTTAGLEPLEELVALSFETPKKFVEFFFADLLREC